MTFFYHLHLIPLSGKIEGPTSSWPATEEGYFDIGPSTSCAAPSLSAFSSSRLRISFSDGIFTLVDSGQVGTVRINGRVLPSNTHHTLLQNDILEFARGNGSSFDPKLSCRVDLISSSSAVLQLPGPYTFTASKRGPAYAREYDAGQSFDAMARHHGLFPALSNPRLSAFTFSSCTITTQHLLGPSRYDPTPSTSGPTLASTVTFRYGDFVDMSKTSKLDSRDPSSTSPRTALSPNPHSSPTTKSSTDSRISDSPTSNAAASTADDGPSQAAEHRAVRLHKKAKDGDDTLIADDSFPHCATVGSDSVATGASARFTTSGLTSVLVPDSPPANVLSPQEDLEPEQEQAAGTLSPNFDGSRASGCTLVKPDSGGSMTEPAQSAASRPSITSALNKSQVVDHVAVHSEDNTAAAAGLISAQVALERIQRAWTATQGLNHTPRNGNARLSSALTALSHVGAAWRSARSALLHATVFHIRP